MTSHAQLHGLALAWAARTDVGRVRRQNQDAVLAGPGLFVVADGMGGHADGAQAASSVVKALEPLMDRLPTSAGQLDQGVQDAVSAVAALPIRSLAEPGSTLTALALGRDGNDALTWFVVNVGDSRTYRLVDGELAQLTVDHSAVQELVDAAIIDADQARVDPRRNILTRAIGAGMEEVSCPDLFPVDLRPARFLLCSDGLSNELDDAQIREVLAAPGEAAAAADRLVELALASGARDNVTVVVVDVAPADGPDLTTLTHDTVTDH